MKMHARSGGTELSNFSRSGAEASLSASLSASASAAASVSPESAAYVKEMEEKAKAYQKELEKKAKDKVSEYKRDFDQKYGEGSSNVALTSAQEGYELYIYLRNHVPIGEQYTSIQWDPSELLRGDESFQGLKNQLADQARMDEETRKARQEDARAMINKIAGTAGAIAAVIPGAGTAVGVAIVAAGYALGYGFQALDNLLSKGDRKKDKQNQQRAIEAAGRLWGEWRIVPPSNDPEISSSGQYADRLERILNVLQLSEGRRPAWQKDWVGTANWILENKDTDRAASDVYMLKWFPVSVEAFYGNSVEADEKGLGFGQVHHVRKDPPKGGAGKVVEYDVVAPTYEQMVKRSSKAVAGIAMAVAAQYGVPPNRVMERAYLAHNESLKISGPTSLESGNRMKMAYMYAVGEAKKLREEMKRDVEELRRNIAAEKARQEAEAARFRKVLSSITQIREVMAPTRDRLAAAKDEILMRKRKGETDAEYALRLNKMQAEKSASETKALLESNRLLAEEQAKLLKERSDRDTADLRALADKREMERRNAASPLALWELITGGRKTAPLTTSKDGASSPEMSPGAKFAIGLGALAVLGGGAYYFYFRKSLHK